MSQIASKLDSQSARFASKVSPEPNSGCWLWTAAINEKGYGRFDNTLAHRAAHLMFKGPVPAGCTVDHLCRNRACVNPVHLEAVPHRTNILRGVVVRHTGRCPHGHPRRLLEQCRECDRIRNARAYTRTSTRRTRGWLSPEEQARIRELIRQGFSHSQVCVVLGVSMATVSRWRNRP